VTPRLVIARRLPVRAAAAGLILVAGLAVAMIDPFADRQALNDAQLDAIRGGFEANGLVASFGIEKAVVVNGELITSTKLIIDNLGALLAGQPASVQIISQAQKTVAGATVASSAPPAQTAASAPTPAAQASPPPAASGTTAAPAASQSMPAPVASNATSAPAASSSTPAPAASQSTPAPAASNTTPAPAASQSAPAPAASQNTPAPAPVASNATPAPAAPQSAPAPAATAASLPLYVQINAAGQIVVIPNGAALAAATATSVQNQANNTTIQTLQQIDAVLSSLSAYKAGVIADAAKQAALAKP
jgi:hypothetical protein